MPRRFGGGTKFFGSDPERAQSLYADFCRSTWTALVAAAPTEEEWGTKRRQTSQRASTNGRQSAAGGMEAKTCRQVAEMVWTLKDSEGISASGRTNWRTRLKPFLDRFGDHPIDSLRPSDIIAFRAAMSFKSVNYQRDVLSYTRAFLSLAWELGELELPYRVKIILANPKKKPPRVKGLTIPQATATFEAVYAENPNIARMLYVGYLTLSRPSELMRLVYGQGEQQDFIRWTVAKTSAKTGLMRPLILTPTGERVLKEITPKYKDYLGLRHQVWRIGRRLREKHGDQCIKELTAKVDLSPHALIRHTPYRCLCEQGVSYDLRRQLMGRGVESVDKHYHPTEDFAEAQKAAEVLSRVIPPSVVGLAPDENRTASALPLTDPPPATTPATAPELSGPCRELS